MLASELTELAERAKLDLNWIGLDAAARKGSRRCLCSPLLGQELEESALFICLPSLSSRAASPSPAWPGARSLAHESLREPGRASEGAAGSLARWLAAWLAAWLASCLSGWLLLCALAARAARQQWQL